jgi:hypothetical protein
MQNTKQSFAFRTLDKLAQFIWILREQHLKKLNDKIDNLAARFWIE